MSVAVTADSFDALLAAGAYGLEPTEKRVQLLAALHDAYRHHFAGCAAYRRYCERRGLAPGKFLAT